MSLINGFGNNNFNRWNSAKPNIVAGGGKTAATAKTSALFATSSTSSAEKVSSEKDKVDPEVLKEGDSLKWWSKVKNWFKDPSQRGVAIGFGIVAGVILGGLTGFLGNLLFYGGITTVVISATKGLQSKGKENNDVKGQSSQDSNVKQEAIKNTTTQANNIPTIKGNPFGTAKAPSWGKKA